MSVRVELFYRDAGAKPPCRWCSRSGIYSGRGALGHHARKLLWDALALAHRLTLDLDGIIAVNRQYHRGEIFTGLYQFQHIPGLCLFEGVELHLASCLIPNPKIIQIRFILVLRGQTGIGQIAFFIVPFLQSTVIEQLQIVLDNAPYTYIEDMKEFIDKVAQMNRVALMFRSH